MIAVEVNDYAGILVGMQPSFSKPVDPLWSYKVDKDL